MSKTPEVRTAVEGNAVVVACVYQGYVPEEVAAALPPGFKARSYVALFRQGRLERVVPGTPEEVVLGLLP